MCPYLVYWVFQLLYKVQLVAVCATKALSTQIKDHMFV